MSSDTWTILGLSAASCLAVALLAAAVLPRWPGRSMTSLLVVTGLVPLLAVTTASLVNVRAMFTSAHDTSVTLLVLAVSAPCSVLTAALLGRRVARGSRSLVDLVERLEVDDEEGAGEVRGRFAGPVPTELAVIAARLAQARTRLAESRRREQQLDRSRRELIAFLSHDLRSPLTGMRAIAEGLEDGVLTDVPAALADLRRGTERLDVMVRDLFELSRLEVAAPQDSSRMPVSLREVVEDVSAEVGELARRRGVRLDVAVDSRLPVLADPDELGRAVANLLDNALRHTPPGGRVSVVGTRDDGGGVRLTVRDACGGIPEADLARVFDVGWRGDAERDPRSGGAGLGLAIVRSVVEAHDGRVAVVNTAGGCEFGLALPPAD